MGLFSKAKKGMQDAAAAAGMASAYDQQQAAAQQPGMVGVTGVGPIAADPALLGGPSTKPLSEDDPMLQPVNGVSLEMYGKAGAEAQRRGANTEDGMAAVIEEMYGIPAADAEAAFPVWIDRMGKSMVVGQQIRKHMGY